MIALPTFEKYDFALSKGGFTVYGGVLSDGKEIREIKINRSTSPRTCEIIYTDGCSYKLSATVEEASGTAIITDITEEWSVPE